MPDTGPGQWTSLGQGSLLPNPMQKMDLGQVVICVLSVKKKCRMNVYPTELASTKAISLRK